MSVSTRRRTQSTRKATKKAKQGAGLSAMTEGGCACCPDCAGKASGTLGQCEDGGCSDIEPQPYFAILVRDPSGHAGLWYPERPANLPPAELAALFGALVGSATPAVLVTLAVMLAPYLTPTLSFPPGGPFGGLQQTQTKAKRRK